MANDSAAAATALSQMQGRAIFELGDTPSLSASLLALEPCHTPSSLSPPNLGLSACAPDQDSDVDDPAPCLCKSPTNQSPLRSAKRKLPDSLSHHHHHHHHGLQCKRVKLEECDGMALHRCQHGETRRGSRSHQISIRALLLPEDAPPPRRRKVDVVLSRLPADAIRLVMQQCTGEALLSLACVCRRFNQEVRGNDALWRSRCANELPYAQLGFDSVEALRWEEDGQLVSWHAVFKCYHGLLADHRISCTGMDPAKKMQQRDLIVAMGGGYQGHLDRSVTVLVVGQTGTDKFKFAKNEGIALVTSAWMEDCFKKRRLLDMADYEPSIFLGLKICVTQIQAGVRSYIEEHASPKGGEYTADLRKAYNTHLIAVRADGRKFQFAHHWGMKVVTPAWFFECLARGEYVDEHPYWIPYAPL